jgi:hypothetical protein
MVSSGGFSGKAMGRLPSLQEKFFDFYQQNRMKNEFILPGMGLKK